MEGDYYMGNKRNQWHPAFYAAMQLELAENKNDLSFQSEVGLNTMPILVDVLVIRKSTDRPIKNEIGRFFKGHNLIEYKSPQDELNIDTFFKGLGYACLYKAKGEKVNSIAFDDMTLTFVRNGKPTKLFKQLQKQGFEIQQISKGIYRISEEFLFEIHMIVSNELPMEEHIWLAVLTDNLSRDQAENLILCTNELQKKDEKEHGDSVLQVAMNANKLLFDELKEDPKMCEALRELMRPEMEAAIKEAEDKKDVIIAEKDALLAEKNDLIVLLQAQLAEAQKKSNA